jgi:hypothetical protein
LVNLPRFGVWEVQEKGERGRLKNYPNSSLIPMTVANTFTRHPEKRKNGYLLFIRLISKVQLVQWRYGLAD